MAHNVSGRFLRFLGATLVLLCLLLAWPAASRDAARAQEEPAGNGVVTDNEVNAVAKDLFCPVCENTPLDVCPTQACADWRELIRMQLGQGMTRQEIFDYFARQYGDGVLANPPRRGVNLVLWLFPLAAILLGGLLFGRYMRQLQAAPAASTPAAPAAPASNGRGREVSEEDYIARVEEELRQG